MSCRAVLARSSVLRPRPNAVEGRRCERFPRLANPRGPTGARTFVAAREPKAHPSLSTRQKKVREAVKTVRSTLSWMWEILEPLLLTLERPGSVLPNILVNRKILAALIARNVENTRLRL
jgi:hypothetical protein